MKPPALRFFTASMNHRIGIKIFVVILIILILTLTIFVISAEIVAAPEKSAGNQPTQARAEDQSPANILPAAPVITTLIFGGDVMLSRTVSQQMEKYNDWTWPFAQIASTLASADLTVINLESPFTESGSHLVKTGSFSFNADPRSAAGLRLAGIDLAGLANNHILNQGVRGLSDTQKILSDNNIAFVGAGLNSFEARKPAIKAINGIKFGFLSYAYPSDNSVAETSTPGIANLAITAMASEVKQLKSQVDVAVILMHAGTEYTNKPNKQQTDFARAAIEAGADAVVGHHPHWVQTTEIYSPGGITSSPKKVIAESGIPRSQGKPILYSLGNLVFDQMWSSETQEGALAKMIWKGKALEKIELIPISIHDYGQAEIVTSTPLKQKILKRMGLTGSLIEL